jgi:hypothetical protein
MVLTKNEPFKMESEISKKIHQIAGLIHRQTELNNLSLFGGNSGIAMFLFYYNRYSNNEKLYKHAINTNLPK